MNDNKICPIFTARLLLRKFREDDFDAVHGYASDFENLIFMQWGPNNEEETKTFINNAIAESEKMPLNQMSFAVTLIDNGELIGGCSLSLDKDSGEMGWILRREYWKRGYGSEAGKALLRLGFDKMKLRRIYARCDSENTGSYRLMKKIGMRRESFTLGCRPANKLSDKKFGDEFLYVITKNEWDEANT